MRRCDKVRNEVAVASADGPDDLVVEPYLRSERQNGNPIRHNLHAEGVAYRHAEARCDKLGDIRRGRCLDDDLRSETERFKGGIDLPAHQAGWREGDEWLSVEIGGCDFALPGKTMTARQNRDRWRAGERFTEHGWVLQAGNHHHHVEPAQQYRFGKKL